MQASDSGSNETGALNRRTLLKLTAVGLAGVVTGAGVTATATRFHRTSTPRYRCLTKEEAALLIEICEQIIPGDDTPGATDAGVIHFIDQQLAGVYAPHLPAYQRGLESFRRTCLQMYQKPFAELATDKKIEALRLIESGRPPAELWKEPSPRAFFSLVVSHTMQGFYGSPRHGGNRGYASYRMLGLDYPQIVGRKVYAKTSA